MGGMQQCQECEQDHPCAGVDFDLVLIGNTSSGVPLYVDRKDVGNDIASLWPFAENFGFVLAFIAELIGPQVLQSLHMFWDSSPVGGSAVPQVFGFNNRSSGAIFLSLRAFHSLHAPLPHVWYPECTAFWLVTLCHELAHHSFAEHDARHETLMERMIERFVPALVRRHVEYAMRGF